MIASTIVAALLVVALGQDASSRDPIGRTERAALWRFREGEPRTISVCWEARPRGYEVEKALVRDHISKTWQQYSSVDFIYWGDCDVARKLGHRPNINIQIVDDPDPRNGPQVRGFDGPGAFEACRQPACDGLGRWIKGRPGAMLLNFTFQKWGKPCASLAPDCIMRKGVRECMPKREACIRHHAVHEFGHALALVHEHNREEAPIECKRLAQGSRGSQDVTVYDPYSVMNYCWKGHGWLSELDIDTIQALYCPRANPKCHSIKPL